MWAKALLKVTKIERRNIRSTYFTRDQIENETDFGDDIGNFMIQTLNEIRDNTFS